MNQYLRISKAKNTNLKIVRTVIIFVVAGLLLSYTNPAYAAVNCAAVNLDDPSPVQILCPLIRIVNILLYSAGAIAMAMIVIAAFKLYTAFGDPKGAMGAKNTLTMAIGGFLVILFLFALLSGVGNLLGIDQKFVGVGAGGIFDETWQNVCDFLWDFGIVSEAPPGCV